MSCRFLTYEQVEVVDADGKVVDVDGKPYCTRYKTSDFDCSECRTRTKLKEKRKDRHYDDADSEW